MEQMFHETFSLDPFVRKILIRTWDRDDNNVQMFRPAEKKLSSSPKFFRMYGQVDFGNKFM